MRRICERLGTPAGIYRAAAGMTAGLALSSLVNSLVTPSNRPLYEARQLGIVSSTILAGYPKHQETITYLIFCFITISLSVIFFLMGSRKLRKEGGGPLIDSPCAPRPSFWPFDYFLVATALLLATFNATVISGSFNSFQFLTEEGTHAGTLLALLHGKVLYRDIYFLYGPLMEYPLVWLARVFGAGLLTIRLYTYFCSFLGLWLVYLLSRRLLERRAWRLLTLALFAAFYFPAYPAPNGTFLRVALGLSCLIPLNSFFCTGKNVYLRLAGLLCGISIFFSQEAGMVALLAALISLGIFFTLPPKKGGNGLFPSIAQFLLGACCAALPIFVYFQAHGALGVFIDTLLSYPRYVMMGYGCLPYPDLWKDFSAKTVMIYYWPIACYLILAAHLCARYLCRRFTRHDLLLLGLLVSGMMLYRSALGRSGADKQLWCLPPLWLLAAAYCEDALKKPIARFIVCSFFFAGVAAFAWWPARGSVKLFLRTLTGQSVADASAIPLAIDGAASIRVPREQTLVIRQVTDYVRARTGSRDFVYCFPEEGMYNFLTRRANPTRFPLAYLMVTTAHRKEAVEDMERRKPAYVIYTRDSWRIDGIPECTAAPEICAYIAGHYAAEREFTGVTLLKRR